MIEFLRKNVIASYGLLVLRFYIGYEWLTAGWGKVTGNFDASGFLAGAIAKAGGEHPSVQGWWAAFLEHVALPNSGLFSFLVAWGELLVGLGLILGCFTTFAATMGLTMNFAFLFSGTLSVNAQMVLLTLFIAVAGMNAGRLGVDRWMMPYLKELFKGMRKGRTTGTDANLKAALH